MNPYFIAGGLLTWLAVGAVISGITDAYLREKRGSAAGIAMGAVFWPIVLALGCVAFIGVGLAALNKVAYDQANRVRAMRVVGYQHADGRLTDKAAPIEKVR